MTLGSKVGLTNSSSLQSRALASFSRVLARGSELRPPSSFAMVTVARPPALARPPWLNPCFLRMRASACPENKSSTPERISSLLLRDCLGLYDTIILVLKVKNDLKRSQSGSRS